LFKLQWNKEIILVNSILLKHKVWHLLQNKDILDPIFNGQLEIKQEFVTNCNQLPKTVSHFICLSWVKELTTKTRNRWKGIEIY
jgi:hypothetical protein